MHLKPPSHLETARPKSRENMVPWVQPFRGGTAPWSLIIRSIVDSAMPYSGNTRLFSSGKADGQGIDVAGTEGRETNTSGKSVIGDTTPVFEFHSPRPFRPPRPIEWPSLPHVRLGSQSWELQLTHTADITTGLATSYPAAPVQTAPSQPPPATDGMSLDGGCDVPFELPQTNPGIHQPTTSPSLSAPSIVFSAGGARPCDTGSGHRSKAIQGLPSIDAIVSQKGGLGTISMASVAPVVLASCPKGDNETQQQRPQSYLQRICARHTANPSAGGQGPPVSGAKRPGDPLHKPLPADQHGPAPAVPGNIYLVPAGPPVPFQNALTTARPMSPVKNPNPKFTKSMRKWTKALGGTAPDLRVVAKLRRCDKMLLRAMRSFEDVNETETKEYKVMAVINKQRVERLGMDTSAVFENGPLSDLNMSLLDEEAKAHGVDGGGGTDGSLGFQALLDGNSRKRKRDEADLSS